METPDQAGIPGVATLEKEEVIQEVNIPEEEDDYTDITRVDQNIEDPGVNHITGSNNAMHGDRPGPIPKNNNNTPKVETVSDNSETEEDKTENEETIQDEEGFEFQINPPSPAEERVWGASQRHGLHPHRQTSFQHKYPINHYTNLMVHVFTQLNLKQRLKLFVNEGKKSTKSEMQ